MEFREWLLKEDPDEVVVGSRSVGWREGVAFFVFDGYCVYAPDTTHGAMFGEMAACVDAIRSGVEGSLSPEGVDACIRDDYGGSAVQTFGAPSVRALRLMLLTVDREGGWPDSFRLRVPGVVQGRIWPRHRVVSFWNGVKDLRGNTTGVLGFVRKVGGDERRFRYEVEGEMLDYEAFRAGGTKSNPLFDPSKVHTMLPGPEKTQMMGAMGFMRSKPVDVRDRLARDGD